MAEAAAACIACHPIKSVLTYGERERRYFHVPALLLLLLLLSFSSIYFNARARAPEAYVAAAAAGRSYKFLRTILVTPRVKGQHIIALGAARL